MNNIERVTSRTECIVDAHLTDMPDLEVPYARPARMMQPFHIKITYMLETSRFPAGWYAQATAVSGLRILKPGPNGERRVGKEHHKKDWYSYNGPLDGLPDWVADIVAELTPTGDVSVPQ